MSWVINFVHYITYRLFIFHCNKRMFSFVLDMYVRDIQTGMTAHNKEPTIVNETAATALVEGNNVLGLYDYLSLKLMIINYQKLSKKKK